MPKWLIMELTLTAFLIKTDFYCSQCLMYTVTVFLSTLAISWFNDIWNDQSITILFLQDCVRCQMFILMKPDTELCTGTAAFATNTNPVYTDNSLSVHSHDLQLKRELDATLQPDDVNYFICIPTTWRQNSNCMLLWLKHYRQDAFIQECTCSSDS